MNDSQKTCETTTEWGVRWPPHPDHKPGEDIELVEFREDALVRLQMYAGLTLVSRQVTRGAWTEVTV